MLIAKMLIQFVVLVILDLIFNSLLMIGHVDPKYIFRVGLAPFNFFEIAIYCLVIIPIAVSSVFVVNAIPSRFLTTSQLKRSMLSFVLGGALVLVIRYAFYVYLTLY